MYEPYGGHVVHVIEFPDLTAKEDYQVSGMHWDFYTGYWIFLATRRGAEELRDTEMSGNTYLIKYDLYKSEVMWTLNLEDRMKSNSGQRRWGDFHGIIIRTFGDAGFPMIWWMGSGPAGLVKISGLAKMRDSRVLLIHSSNGLIGYLDMLRDFGAEPADWLESSYRNVRIRDVQSITLPPKYADKVALLTSPTRGVQVMQNFGWKWTKGDWLNHRHSVQHTHGVLVPPADTEKNGQPWETVQVGSNSVFVLSRFKDGQKKKNGNDENFWRFEDITKLIEDNLALNISPTDGFTGWKDPNIWPDADMIRELSPVLPEGWYLQLGPEGKQPDFKVTLDLGIQLDLPPSS